MTTAITAAASPEAGAGTTQTAEQTPEQKAAAEAEAAKTAAEQTPEQKAAAEAKAKEDAEKAKKTGAPEKYEDFKLPEGVVLDTAALEAFLPLAKEAGLTQDMAQKLVDLQTKMLGDAATAQNKAWEEIQAKWLSDARADKEIGGQKFDEHVGYAQKFLEAFGTPDLKAALDATGTGNHPEIIRAFARAGKAIAEGKIVHGGNATQTAKSQADILFG